MVQYSWLWSLVALIVSIFVLFKVLGFDRRLTEIFRGNKGKDLEGVISEATKRLVAIEKEFKNLRDDVARIDVMATDAVQKVGVVRFNPFDDTGGDQSFAIALLDANDNGAVISSLYSREGARIFAKAIVRGSSKHHLSDEEREAIRRALQNE